VETGRIRVWGQPRKSSQDPTNELGMVVCTCHASYAESINRRIIGSGQIRHKVRTYLKNNQSQRTGGMAQVAKCLPNKHKALSITKKKKKKKKSKESYLSVEDKGYLSGYSEKES
jgi:hypothetical protein